MKFIIDTWRDLGTLFLVKNLTHSDLDGHVFFLVTKQIRKLCGGESGILFNKNNQVIYI